MLPGISRVPLLPLRTTAALALSACPLAALAMLAASLLAKPAPLAAQRPEQAKVVEPDDAKPPIDLNVQIDAPPRQVAPQPPVFEDRIQVAEVLLDVLVTDKQGNVVPGLGVEDFVVYEDGRPVQLESVTFYGDSASLTAPAEGRTDRYFIFFFHHEKDRSMFQQSAQNRMARDAEKWLERELLPNDQVAVISFDFDLWLHQDFTRDRELVLEAVDDAARGRKTQGSRGDPSPRRAPSTSGRSGDSPSLFRNLPTYRDFRRQTRTFQEALEMVAKGAGSVVGRKNLLLFSGGFGQVSGITELHTDSEIYKRMEHALNTSNVAVYGFDILGIQTGDPRNASYGSMSNLSWDTGGRYFERDGSFLKPLQRVGFENRGYYLLSYQTSFDKDESGYRRVEIGTPGGAYFVRGRSGYEYGRRDR